MTGSRRRVPAVLVPLALIVVLGVAGAVVSAKGGQLDSALGGWTPDGAATDTFWDSPMIDVPGLSLFSVHCHGYARLDFQAGATGPNHNNPCYAAMGMYEGPGGQEETLYVLPGGGKAIYRSSVNWGPWTYFIGDMTNGPPPGGGSG
ncbi:MAG TPA: hypothetical protein VLK30_09585 [Candidatus Limnocylindrales bacterium]|nr:hypothetical protein [Candidatus Limnocylindrales bacterium]